MTLIPNLSAGDQPRPEAEKSIVEKMTQLAALIQEYPAEAQLIMAAVEEGLSIGPAQVMDVVDAHDPDSGATVPATEGALTPGAREG
jgi:hypothetical protein